LKVGHFEVSPPFQSMVLRLAGTRVALAASESLLLTAWNHELATSTGDGGPVGFDGPDGPKKAQRVAPITIRTANSLIR
jgi:hypothetical protein